MLKFRIISIVVLLLLMLGINLNASASVNSDETTKETKDKESPQHEPKETIAELDFFGAFSLVNIQLQWRDIHVGTIKDVDEEPSEDQKELTAHDVKTVLTELNSGYDVQPSTLNTAADPMPVIVYAPVSDILSLPQDENKQRANTIAFILNCGTYPLSS